MTIQQPSSLTESMQATAITERAAKAAPLPSPPTDTERTAYIRRGLPLLTVVSLVSFSCLTVSQVRFASLAPGCGGASPRSRSPSSTTWCRCG